MTEETNTAPTEVEPIESEPKESAEDARFEVKWTKKATSSSATPESTIVASADMQALQRQLEEAEARIQDLQDRWHRSAADLANLRKRTEAEKEDVERFASMVLMAELLPVLDNFERALSTLPGNLAMLTWIQGVMLIERHLRALLEQRGLTPIDAEGKPFSPHVHEAISERETMDEPPGTIMQVYQKGYTMHGRVIRPSLVEIAKAPADPVPETEIVVDAEIVEIVEQTETENTGP